MAPQPHKLVKAHSFLRRAAGGKNDESCRSRSLAGGKRQRHEAARYCSQVLLLLFAFSPSVHSLVAPCREKLERRHSPLAPNRREISGGGNIDVNHGLLPLAMHPYPMVKHSASAALPQKCVGELNRTLSVTY